MVFPTQVAGLGSGSAGCVRGSRRHRIARVHGRTAAARACRAAASSARKLRSHPPGRAVRRTDCPPFTAEHLPRDEPLTRFITPWTAGRTYVPCLEVPGQARAPVTGLGDGIHATSVDNLVHEPLGSDLASFTASGSRPSGTHRSVADGCPGIAMFWTSVIAARVLSPGHALCRPRRFPAWASERLAPRPLQVRWLPHNATLRAAR